MNTEVLELSALIELGILQNKDRKGPLILIDFFKAIKDLFFVLLNVQDTWSESWFLLLLLSL